MFSVYLTNLSILGLSTKTHLKGHIRQTNVAYFVMAYIVDKMFGHLKRHGGMRIPGPTMLWA